MFRWKQKAAQLDELAKLRSPLSATGINRRAINLVPLPISEDRREIRKSHHMRYQQMLLTLEAKQSSCCLRVVNPDKKSRSAILVFRGRVLGCIYGRKGLHGQLFGEEAFGQAFVELTRHDNIVDTYLLNEEIVLAGAAMFHGAPLSIPEPTAEGAFDWSAQKLLESNMPGCIVIHNEEGLVVGMTYVFNGQTVGVYSFKDGWVDPTIEAGKKLLTNSNNCTVASSCFTAKNVDEVIRLTFSLTGLGRTATSPSSFHRSSHRMAAR